MAMAKVTVWLPDELYAEVRRRRGTPGEVNVSQLATAAVRAYLRYGPEAEAEMEELAHDLETDPEYRAIAAETDALAGEGLRPVTADEADWIRWLEAGKPAIWPPGPAQPPGAAPGPPRPVTGPRAARRAGSGGRPGRQAGRAR
jgi:hypothetical protein